MRPLTRSRHGEELGEKVQETAVKAGPLPRSLKETTARKGAREGFMRKKGGVCTNSKNNPTLNLRSVTQTH